MTGSGPIADGAPRWVTATKDGHLPAFVTRWLSNPPVVIAFDNPWTTWTTPHEFAYPPSVSIFNSDGKSIEAEVSSNYTSVTVVFSEPMTGFLVLR